MHTEYNFTLTEKASSAARALDLQSVRFQMEAQMPALMPGDLLSTEETMPLVLLIVRRHFHFVDPDHLQVDVLLDLPAG